MSPSKRILHVTQSARDRARSMAWFSAQEAVRNGLLSGAGGLPEVKPFQGLNSRPDQGKTGKN